MSERSFSPLDRLIGEINIAINVLSTVPRANRASPAASHGDLVLDEPERRQSARLMRVNHSGEVAAQALYKGQALTARNERIGDALHQAAEEEMDHLAWCDARLKELNGPTSLFNPFWYLGSFAIGAAAGAFGDPVSMGFIVETEKQVEAHLRSHTDRLPPADHRSRAIVDQMTHDEAAHGAQAASLGAKALPFWVRGAMRLTSRLMTQVSYWL